MLVVESGKLCQADNGSTCEDIIALIEIDVQSFITRPIFRNYRDLVLALSTYILLRRIKQSKGRAINQNIPLQAYNRIVGHLHTSN